MGMDFTAFLGHKLNRDEIQILCHALNSRSLKHVDEFITRLLPHNPKDKGKPWTVHEGIGGTVESMDLAECNLLSQKRYVIFIII